ncbi:MAG: hypothetical protein H0W16_02470 [Actinobacteria bacterium]|nr:hypothetical protein [Actinomycetota bacterium]
MPKLADLTPTASTAMFVFPGDPGWDDVRRAWGLLGGQRPAAVARPETVADVVAALDHAQVVGFDVVVRTADHRGTLHRPLHGTLLIDLGRLSGLA